ncbi:MAG: glycosyltransferase [Acidobacteria bacterium]|nr:glycosyltransferase [Acidobacteriota bacterium]
MLWLWLTLPGAIIWLGVLLAPWRPWSTREHLEALPEAIPPETFSDLTVLIPARNEAAGIGRTLRSLEAQAPDLHVVVVDDRSTDGTTEAARAAAGSLRLEVLPGEPAPEGWSGKLWALHQGLQRIVTPRTLLLDADIEMVPGTLPALRHKMDSDGLQLVSLMAALSMEGFWARLLIPAFIWFFKLLYPFRLANSPRSRIAAAAGGCILLDTAALREAGGFESIRHELIDDCSLARRFKEHGRQTWIGLSRSLTSHRPCRGLSPVWQMVTRTAYTQLRYSPSLLALVVVVMLLAFAAPVAGLAAPFPTARLAALTALVSMSVAQAPLLRFYGLSPLRALLLPLAALLYLAMTIHSALRYHRGIRSSWRGRTYRS